MTGAKAARSVAEQFGELTLATQTENPEPSVQISSGGEGFLDAAVELNKGGI